MPSISSQLVGKTAEEKAIIKAQAFASSNIKFASITIDGYVITITGKSYDASRKLLIIEFTAKNPSGNPVDLCGPYEFYNPPIMVPSGKVDGKMVYTENVLQALKTIFTDTMRYVRKEKGLP